MPDLSTIRNPEAEHINAHVVVSMSLSERAGIAMAYAGLTGRVIYLDKQTGECLVRLDQASHERFLGIGGAAFTKCYGDFEEEQWFCSGVLEVVK